MSLIFEIFLSSLHFSFRFLLFRHIPVKFFFFNPKLLPFVLNSIADDNKDFGGL